jgi:hypothetical protein
MATGIEMLGQMGTDQSLAGPVEGGNMVVKPNQVPVGGAAMLSKALRKQTDKGVGGMYVLPEQEDQTPDFMKIAESNVMRDINGQRNQFPGNFSEAEGGIIPMLPRNLKTAPGADETTLAYITPEEQAILGLLNPGTPHRGPEQIPTYDSVDWDPTSGQYSVTSGAQASAYEKPASQRTQQEKRDVGAMNQQAYETEKSGGWTPQEIAHSEDKPWVERGGQWVPEDWKPLAEDKDKVVTESQSNDQKQLANAIKNDNQEEAKKIIEKNKDDMSFFETFKTMYNDTLGSGINKVAEWGGSIFSDKGKDGKDTKKGDRTKKFISNLFGGPSAWMLAGAGKMLEDFKVTPEKLRDENYLAIMKDAFKKDPGRQEEFEEKYAGMISDVYGEGEEGEGFSAALSGAVAPEGSESQRRTDPEKYYDIDRYKELRDKDGKYEGKFFKPLSSRFAATSGNLEDIASIDVNMPGLSREFKQKIFNAREEVNRNKADHGQGGRPGAMGGGVGPIIEDEILPVVEEGATTMPYTGPRTGGAEVNVPLSRRFALDPTQDVAQYKTAPRSTEDIYKYYTQGTEGEGLSLEPYNEFQKRRRKALGLDNLDFWSS